MFEVDKYLVIVLFNNKQPLSVQRSSVLTEKIVIKVEKQ